MSDYNDTLLRTTLAIAVPLWQNEYQRRPLAVVLAIAADKAQMIAEHGDIIMFRGQKRGQSADAFNALASGLAILSFMPGGVTFRGDHYEATHHESVGSR